MPRLLFLLTVALVALLPATPRASEAPQDFTAKLDLIRNGKLMGTTTIDFVTDDGNWIMRTQTEGTRGLARFLGLEERSRSEGDWLEGNPRPKQFERTVKAVISRNWSADFDWERGVVHTVYPDGESVLELKPGTIDETTVGLLIRSGLLRGEEEWFLRVVDEDEIEDHHYRKLASERLQTSLGCLSVSRVEKIRDPASKRYTRTYYADGLGFVPVFIEHGKQGEDHLETRIVSLTLEGEQVPHGAACDREDVEGGSKGSEPGDSRDSV